MGLFNFFKKQFIDVIEWNESQDGILAYRYPMQDNEIQTGAKLTVRESQMAMFVDQGQIADVFTPGLYTLNTRNLPLLTNLKNWDKLFESPFKSDVYFFSTREQIDQRWGTQTPIIIRDKEAGAIRLRANGTYSYQIKDPKQFYKKISGSREVYTTGEIDGQLRAAILTSLATFFGSAQISFIDMAANQTKFSETAKEVLTLTFADYGLQLNTFYVQSISLPEELQTYFDKAASMRMVGDMGRFIQFQTGDSIPKAAANEGGGAGVGMGLGAGIAMGQGMAQSMAGAMNSAGQAAGAGGGAQAVPEDPIATLAKLHELVGKGILTQSEFDAKKAELLQKIK